MIFVQRYHLNWVVRKKFQHEICEGCVPAHGMTFAALETRSGKTSTFNLVFTKYVDRSYNVPLESLRNVWAAEIWSCELMISIVTAL